MNTRRPAPSEPGFTFSAGKRLGPYEIVSPLGVGGMGEVYRARDSRLRREVAVKILHRSLSLTPEHVDRLGREARAAGSLNHPNILAVYDVGTEGAVPYVVSELLEGESLRVRLARGPLPYRKALEYGIRLAQALGAAHEKGIWHRDVKPGNVFITSDGRIKLLDFGLVKLRPRAGMIDSKESTADVTEPGGVHGTLGYMSPEQVLGEAVDERSDLFALGAVLYEMFTGVPAFRRGSPMETTKAVLNEEPADELERHGVPAAAAAVVRRCLEKNEGERFQSARDLAFHLEQLQEIAAAAPGPAPRFPRKRWAVAALLGLGLLAAAASLVFRGAPPPSPTFQQLTFRRGRIGGARFAEGGAIVYSESREGRPLEVRWLGGPDSAEARLLGHTGSDVLAAHGGKLALSLGRRFVLGERFVGTLAEVPLGEGAPRKLAENIEDADWDPSGGRLVVAHWLTVGGESRLEYPPGTVLHTTSGSIRSPRFSRDGRRIAFLEDPTGRGAGGKVAVVDLEGRYTPLTEAWTSAHGLAWSPTGGEIWFAAGPSPANRALRAVDLERRQRMVLAAPGSITLWDIASDGRVLLARDDERSALVGAPPGETTERDLSWFDTSALADLSEDGRLILFADRFGLYIRGTDGSPPVHLGLKEGFGDDFSADGTKVLATSASSDRLMVLPAGVGDPVPVPAHGIASYKGAFWFPDGRHILFNGTQPGHKLRAFVQDLEGGAPQALTPEDTWVSAISPDGGWVAAIGSQPGIQLWPVAGGSPRSVPSQPGDRPVAWTADGRSLWVFHRGEVPAEVSHVDIATGRREVWKKLQPPDSSGVYSITDFRVTSDGRAYFYSYKRLLSQLYTVTGLK